MDKEDEMTNLGAGQVHDPFLKRVLAEAIKVLMKTVKEEKVERIEDFLQGKVTK